MGFLISLSNFQKNSLSERLLEWKAVTLSDELTEHKANFTRTVLVNCFLRGKL